MTNFLIKFNVLVTKGDRKSKNMKIENSHQMGSENSPKIVIITGRRRQGPLQLGSHADMIQMMTSASCGHL